MDRDFQTWIAAFITSTVAAWIVASAANDPLTLILAILSAVIATLIAAGVTAMISRARAPSLRKLYREACKRVTVEMPLDRADSDLLASILSSSAGFNIVDTGKTPEEEMPLLRALIVSLAKPPQRMAQPEYARKVVERLLTAEFEIEGKDRNRQYHERMQRRRPHFPLSATPAQRGSQPGVEALFWPPERIDGVANQLIGREAELSQLHERVADSASHLMVIEGFGGVGKTTLAARLARDIADTFNVLWVACEATVTADSVLRALGERAARDYAYPDLKAALETGELSAGEKRNVLIAFLAAAGRASDAQSPAKRPIALFFENFHLVDDPALVNMVTAIADCGANVKVVLTLRRQQHLSPQLLTHIEWSRPVVLEGLSREDCRAFLEAHASTFPAVSGISAETLERVWERTGKGVPMALRVLLPLTASLKLSLDQLLDSLPTYNSVSPDAKQWFDSLFGELSPSEQQLVREMSVLRLPASLPLLHRLSTVASVDAAVEQLISRFILSPTGNLYSMHALWSEYARQLLGPQQARDVHLRAAEAYRDEKSTGRYAATMNAIESCYHFIQAGAVEQAMLALKPIAETLGGWGLFREFEELFTAIQDAAQQAGVPIDPELLLEWGSLQRAHGEISAAEMTLEDLVTTTDGTTKIKSLQELGWLNFDRGDRHAARDLFEQSVTLARAQGQAKLEGNGLRGLHNVAYAESRYDDAMGYDEARLRIFQALRDDEEATEAITWTYRDIGNIYRERGDTARALSLYQQALAEANKLNDPPIHVGWLYYDMGQLQRDAGAYSEAQELFSKSYQHFESIRHQNGMVHAEIELGRVGSHLGEGDQAAQRVLRCIEDCRRTGNRSGEAYGLRALGDVYLNLGQPERAVDYLEQSLALDRNELHGEKGIAQSQHLLGRAHEMMGQRLLASGNRPQAGSELRMARDALREAHDLYAKMQVRADLDGLASDVQRVADELAQVE
jgi:tetratricopeptide (TPR) repeat protein